MKKCFKILSLVVLVALLGAARPIRISATDSDIWSERCLPTVVASQSRVTRFLVLGKDRASGLTDSIFVVSVNEGARRASILQIPRDTYADYTEKSYKKLNGALGALGESGVKQMLSRALGVHLDYFLILDLSCVRHIVDDLGGVDIEIEQDMIYSDPAQGLEINLPRGRAHLNGNQAEQFIRYRSGYVNADLGRLDAQKRFLIAFAEKCKSVSASQLFGVVCHSLTRVQTDVGLPDAIRVLSVLRECEPSSVPMATLAGKPVQGKSGAWYYAVNRAGACRMVSEYLMVDISSAELAFDPDGIFDRRESVDFHTVYTAPEESLEE